MSGSSTLTAFGTWLAMHPEIPVGQRGFFDDPEFDTFPYGVEFLLDLLPMADSRSTATNPNAGNPPQLTRGTNWTDTLLTSPDGSPQNIEETFTPGGSTLLRFGVAPGAAP